MSRKFLELTGQRFGRLLVVSRSEDKIFENGVHRSRWNCLCDCGNTAIVIGANLTNGHTQSCGCLHRETTSKTHKKHGLKRTRLYGIWSNMKDRCYRQTNQFYADYGGRGITVCEEWLDNFLAFREWALANGYQDNLTLDRIDNNGPYSPDNCRWANKTQQANNKRSNRLLTYKGKTQTLAQWAKEYGITQSCLGLRINRYKWPIEKALTEPLKSIKHQK